MKRQGLHFRIAAALIFIAGLIAALVFLPIKSWLVRFIGWIRGFGPAGSILYGAVYVLGTVLLVPGTALTAGAGLIYGPWIGTLIVSPASVLGATLAFLIARYFARDWVERKIENHKRFQALDSAIEKNGFKVIFLLRLEPIFLPFALLNYALGLTSVRLRDYVLASWLGMLPATFLYVYLGSALHNISDLVSGRLPAVGIWGEVLFWSGLAAAALLLLLLGRIAKRALRAELEESHQAHGSVA